MLEYYSIDVDDFTIQMNIFFGIREVFQTITNRNFTIDLIYIKYLFLRFS